MEFITTSQTKVVIIDPSVLNTRERLRVFLESLIFKEYLSLLPSSISSLIKEEKWDKLVNLLRRWEWNLDRRKSDEWFASSEFKDLCRKLNAVCISFEQIKKELTGDERKILSIVRDILGPESPILVDLAKELVEIAITKQAGIFSFTRHFKRWLKSLRAVLILEISEKTDALSQAKREFKVRLRNSGWGHHFYIIFLRIVTSLGLKTVLPTIIHWTIDTALKAVANYIIVGVIIDGF